MTVSMKRLVVMEKIEVTLDKNGSLTVIDDGRVDEHPGNCKLLF